MPWFATLGGLGLYLTRLVILLRSCFALLSEGWWREGACECDFWERGGIMVRWYQGAGVESEERGAKDKESHIQGWFLSELATEETTCESSGKDVHSCRVAWD